ncbi:unnamed protein product [Ilex paraguariensis]|uniref:Tyrosine decarboxylase n=1 Tax=Ilex paraguariensis TaxID=185542 RepID=A0ABC8RJI7_9AQUA
MGKLVVYGSDQTHCALQKAVKIAGINPLNFRCLLTTKSTGFGLSPDALRSAIQSDIKFGLIPLFFCATIGTTSSNAVDPLGPLCDVTKDYNIWVHIDAAYAGSAFICPEFRHFLDGIEVFEELGFRFKPTGGLQRLANSIEPTIPSNEAMACAQKLWTICYIATTPLPQEKPPNSTLIPMGTIKMNIDLDNYLNTTMNPLDPEEFRRQGHMIVDFLADYYKNVEKHPVRSQVEPGYLRKRLPELAPDEPETIETILKDVQKDIIPGLTHWQSPNFFGYFPSSGSVAGFIGEVLSSGFNVVGFNWISSPAATELESIVTDWFGKMLNLPISFLFSGGGGGVLQGTTCEAILCTLTAARDQMLDKIGRENMGKLVVYGSDQTHCALQKAAKIAGINPLNFRSLLTTKSTGFGLSPDALRSAIQSDIKFGLIPLFFCATIGTTSSNAVDPLGPLCDVAKDYNIWVHVDAAYAGSAFICPEFRHFLDGIEGANSFSLNAHKWFFTTLDCCCLWVKEPSALIKALSTDPEYLKNKASDSNQVVDYKDWQIALSRRFRAMKLWLVLRSYGVSNLRNFIRGHVKMAKHFEGLIAMDKRFEVVVRRNFAMVCFRVSPLMVGNATQKLLGEGDANEFNKKLLESINATGRVYMTHAVVGGVYVIRLAVGATLTDYCHVNKAWKEIKEHAHAMQNEFL